MIITVENVLLILAVLLFLSVLAGKTSYKFGVPTLLFFLAIGMLAGSEGIGKIYFDNPATAQFIGIIALNFILFSGGLDTSWESIKPIVKQGVILSTLGVLLTAFIAGTFIYLITDLSLYEGLLLGSIVSSTDAAAVFSILRSRSIALKDNLRPTLEFESGSNDPMANVLTVTFISLILAEDASLFSSIPFFLKQIIIGLACGFGFGFLNKFLINKIKPDFEGLYPVLVISLMLFSYSFTDLIGGNGFLATYVSGVILGNQEIIHKKTIVKAFDGFSWIMQIIMFLTLGLLVFPSQLIPVAGVALLISAFMIIVARPISVWVSLIFVKGVKARSKWYISWVGLRGAVPIVFATYPLIAGIESAHFIFNVVFFISLTSVLIQGTTLTVVAKWLGVSLPSEEKSINQSDLLRIETDKTELKKIRIKPENPAVGKQIVQLNLPSTSIISIIFRDGKYLIPEGETHLNAEDELFILADNVFDLYDIYKKLNISISDEDAIYEIESIPEEEDS